MRLMSDSGRELSVLPSRWLRVYNDILSTGLDLTECRRWFHPTKEGGRQPIDLRISTFMTGRSPKP
jgi:hypothetical protein